MWKNLAEGFWGVPCETLKRLVMRHLKEISTVKGRTADDCRSRYGLENHWQGSSQLDLGFLLWWGRGEHYKRKQLQWADEEVSLFLGGRRLFIHKPTDGKLFQHWIILCCFMGNFCSPLPKISYIFRWQKWWNRCYTISSTLIELTAGVFSQILSFWQHLCFHKLLSHSVYLQGDSFLFRWRGACFFFFWC